MSFWKRILLCASLFILLLSALNIPFRTQLRERFSVLRNGWGDRTYLWAAAGENGLMCAVSLDGANRVLSEKPIPDGLELRFFNRQGTVAADWTAALPREAVEGELCGLYPVDTETAFLAVYQRGEAEETALVVYRATKGGDSDPVFSQEGTGNSQMAKRDSVRISSFSRSLDRVHFSILMPDRAISYTCPVSGGGVMIRETQVRTDIKTSAALPDGGLAVAGRGFLSVPNWTNSNVSDSLAFSRITCSSTGIYTVDEHTLSVWYSDFSNVSIQQLYSLDPIITGHRVNSLTLTPDGEALVLLGGHRLYLVQGGGVSDLTSALYPGPADSFLALALWIAGSLLLTWILWQVFSILTQNRLPLALYWGPVILAVAMAFGFMLRHWVIVPNAEQTALEQQTEVVSAAVGMVMRERTASRAGVPQGAATSGNATDSLSMARKLETLLKNASSWNTQRLDEVNIEDETSAEGLVRLQGKKRLAEANSLGVSMAYLDGSAWYQDDIRAELLPTFYPELAAQVRPGHPVSAHDGQRYWYCQAAENEVLTVSVVFHREDLDDQAIWNNVVILCVMMTAVMMVVLVLLNADVRRVSRGLERYAAGERWIPLRLHSGDELEGMAVSLNALAAGRAQEDRKRNELAASYRRFVPESVLALLGKKSILDVDQESFATHHCAIMAVSFTFAAPVYANTRLLFESINRVIERTASLAEKKGGTVFNFNVDGYDVVMENGQQAVSVAVTIGQEVLALNERRTASGLPPVTLRMALDEGDVVIGIVGDGIHLEQTTISSHFSVVRSLIRLAEKLDAYILCTEAIHSSTDKYGSRYMGKARTGGELVRVYEIFDADSYSIRRQKESTLSRFSQGVLHLYSGDIQQAKRIFLAMAHDTPDDGGARYYLYLADQLERNPEAACELNGAG